MYIVVERKQLPEGRYYKTLPDGRCIVSMRTAKALGVIEGATVVSDARAMHMMMADAEKADYEDAVEVAEDSDAGEKDVEPDNDKEE